MQVPSESCPLCKECPPDAKNKERELGCGSVDTVLFMHMQGGAEFLRSYTNPWCAVLAVIPVLGKWKLKPRFLKGCGGE